jgi:hypothetical protein
MERLQWLSERDAVSRLLAMTPADALIDRLSLEDRLELIDAQLKQLSPPGPEPARVRLTFNGRPVVGCHGILAEFGVKAVQAFTDAVAAVAASLTAPLAAMGRIPNREAHQMLITGTAVGSFGFELEELPSAQVDWIETSAVSRALNHAQELLRGTTAPDDDLLADTAAELDQRAIDKVRHFVSVLRDHDATCALELGNSVFRFRDSAEVQSSLDRLSRENLQEEVVEIHGRFEGLLPRRRTFEFRRTDNNEVLTGKLAAAIQQPERVNDHLGEPIVIRLTRTVVGRGRPRFVVHALPDSWFGEAT